MSPGGLDYQRKSAVRWVASKVKVTVLDRPWKVLSAAVGSASWTRRLALAPVALRLVVAAARSRFAPMAGRDAMIGVVLPEQSSSLVVAALVQATEHWSTLTWRPLVASEVSAVTVAAGATVVVSLT